MEKIVLQRIPLVDPPGVMYKFRIPLPKEEGGKKTVKALPRIRLVCKTHLSCKVEQKNDPAVCSGLQTGNQSSE